MGEARSAKADYLSLETELYQNTHSLKELNHRYKQLHAQWVQSQTRNRELQRDMMKMKKDSERCTRQVIRWKHVCLVLHSNLKTIRINEFMRGMNLCPCLDS